MDVFLQGEWFEFAFPSGKILGFKLKPMSYEEGLIWLRDTEENFYNYVFDHIIDWRGLAKDGEKIEPTPENVKLYMPYFLTARVERIGSDLGPAKIQESGPAEDEEKKEIPTLGFQLVTILQNIENFLGN